MNLWVMSLPLISAEAPIHWFHSSLNQFIWLPWLLRRKETSPHQQTTKEERAPNPFSSLSWLLAKSMRTVMRINKNKTTLARQERNKAEWRRKEWCESWRQTYNQQPVNLNSLNSIEGAALFCFIHSHSFRSSSIPPNPINQWNSMALNWISCWLVGSIPKFR